MNDVVAVPDGVVVFAVFCIVVVSGRAEPVEPDVTSKLAVAWLLFESVAAIVCAPTVAPAGTVMNAMKLPVLVETVVGLVAKVIPSNEMKIWFPVVT